MSVYAYLCLLYTAPDKNPDYCQMTERARDSIVRFVDREWYKSSSDGEDEDVEMLS